MTSEISLDSLGIEFKCYNIPELDLSPLLDAAVRKEREEMHGGVDSAFAQQPANSASAQRPASNTLPLDTPPSIDVSILSGLQGAARHKMAHKMKRQHKRLMMDTRAREARLNLSNIERANNHAVPIDHSDAEHSKPGWIGLRVPTNDFGDIDGLLRKGYKLIKYERKSCAFSDKHNRVFSVFIDCPAGMLGVNEELCSAMAVAQTKLQFGKSSNAKDSSTRVKPPRRGDFPSISVGISYGSGQSEPGNLAHTANNQHVLDILLKTPAVKRVAAFQSNCYRAWMPRLHEASGKVLSELLEWKPSLRRNFANSVYCCMTFNFGPHVICKGHRDHLNWAPEAKLIIEFPPGCSIIVPSACITHGNLPILKSENRISMTQYTAGGLVRWLDYQCRSAAEFEKIDCKGKNAMDDKGHERWKDGVGMYSTIAELKEFWSSRAGRA
ncbi:hypothetical protein LshimejAT787_0103910 [Lyophyllum shimeji]|uniref:Uncharacterized protein n=1 Tax=Lyophyllum shimeji TaxID=47721 RepID=A0A9P3PCU6_LYOSH|nr:hypothetical protein LshimejAT787_0103170 [Lyophyllum shimeji]GLB33507.1 hypothetical protein LshimejAT787_0103910 [Lyophyllum shimeji]